ncbi:MAG TPA: histidine phosphatase family protein [Candidatus Kaiserbacteria bacterium]|nr:histidine phosphatase family protein [Candidatus Kaiserbacteria bacterium]
MEIVFVRHGNAEPRDPNAKDFVADELARQLTEKGRSQVPRNLGKFDLVFSSPAMRAKETAKIAAPGMDPTIINALSTHLWEGDWESVDNLFVNQGNRSLVEAYSIASEKEMEAVRAISMEAFEAIKKCVRENGLGVGSRILMAGHAMHLQALAEEFDAMYAHHPEEWDGWDATQGLNWSTPIREVILSEGGSFRAIAPCQSYEFHGLRQINLW